MVSNGEKHMSQQSRRCQLTEIRGRQYPALVFLLALSMLLTLVLKRPELYAVSIPELTRLLQFPAVRTYLETMLGTRYQQDFLENLQQRLLSYGDWSSFDLNIESLSLGSRAKYLLVGSALDVSVIVPTWNEEKYLSKCLQSLRNQASTKPLEIIVVDGGSTDRTVEIAEEHADKVLVEPNKLVGAARNIGAQNALGNVLAFIDADTVVATDWVEAIENGFKDHSAIGVTGPTLPYNGDVLDTITYRLWTIYLQRILLSARMPHVIGFNCAYKKDVFLRAGGFDETFVMSEDIRLAVKMRRFGRIKFEKEMFALTSPRRFQKFGHAYIAGLYLFNGFSTLLLNRSSRNYPPVR